ncbi:hypothetical protein CtesDRAFT_PD3263 [Comamonas testosteroni KF-1]|uniref:Uncharacterized protein n=1 Tax=Comamonas testosteroni (strain DSM 14576 / KF-1) TaxID=399795 RepID=B7X0Y5_COMTK|nr:hypothetical protein CtesDRAFT_PD3263 [Comamonas testosteroni KF-1]
MNDTMLWRFVQDKCFASTSHAWEGGTVQSRT